MFCWCKLSITQSVRISDVKWLILDKLCTQTTVNSYKCNNKPQFEMKEDPKFPVFFLWQSHATHFFSVVVKCFVVTFELVFPIGKIPIKAFNVIIWVEMGGFSHQNIMVKETQLNDKKDHKRFWRWYITRIALW